jgi:hypothetical protein
MRTPGASLVVLFAAASVAAQPARPGPRPALRDHLPVGALAPPPRPCQVRLSLVRKTVGRRVRLVARATNLTRAPLTLTLPDACPGGAIRFFGLPASHDYYEVCNAGACPGPREARALTLAPGQTVALASIVIDPRGTSCNPPLPPGEHAVGFSLPGGLATCGPAEVTLAVAVARPAPHVAPAPRPRRRCPPLPACGIGCNGPQARDANGCVLCACERDELEAP